jgi:hypothetical protein
MRSYKRIGLRLALSPTIFTYYVFLLALVVVDAKSKIEICEYYRVIHKLHEHPECLRGNQILWFKFLHSLESSEREYLAQKFCDDKYTRHSILDSDMETSTEKPELPSCSA